MEYGVRTEMIEELYKINKNGAQYIDGLEMVTSSSGRWKRGPAGSMQAMDIIGILDKLLSLLHY